MGRELKVYSWQGFRRDCKTHSCQTREVVAAYSRAEAARAAGVKDPRQLFNFGETGSPHDRQAALAEVGAVFWRPIDGVHDPYTKGKP